MQPSVASATELTGLRCFLPWGPYRSNNRSIMGLGFRAWGSYRSNNRSIMG